LAALELLDAGAGRSGPDGGQAHRSGTVPPPPEAQSPSDLIRSIWVRVLGHDEFDLDDDFFDVGGDSLLATWVVAELGQALGRPVELSVFLDYSTVEDLAAVVGSSAPAAEQLPQSSQIVTLRAGPSGRSLYLLHPLGGELLGYRELARASRAPLRLLGIGWRGEAPPFGTSLAEIARVHVEQLRTIEPDGPYRLAGWSFGGVLAYEMAQQLVAAGGEVEFLALLDANPVIDPITGLPKDRTPFLDMLDAVVDRIDDPAATEADLAELTSGETWTQLMGAPVAAGSSSPYLRTALETARSCMNAAMRYRPDRYAGPVHLFLAAGTDRAHQARLIEAMRELCTGSLTVTPIPGDHWGFIRGERVTEAARQLDAALERVGAVGSVQNGS
jgi:thioesterase domain-containing protein/acyl carrier protein